MNRHLTLVADEVLADLRTKTASAPTQTEIGDMLMKVASAVREAADAPVEVTYADLRAVWEAYGR